MTYRHAAPRHRGAPMAEGAAGTERGAAAANRRSVGLRVLSNPLWRGGVNYVANWTRALNSLSAGERPRVYLLPFDDRGEALAKDFAGLVEGVHPFARAHELDLDLVYPATQIFEAPFGAPWAGWIPDWQCQYLPEMFDDLELARRRLQYGILAMRSPCLVTSSRMALADTRRVVGETVDALVLPFPAMIGAVDAEEDAAVFEDLRRRRRLPERFFLIANQFWKHKNHALVFEALARVRAPDIACVFTGETEDPRWPGHFGELKALIAERGIGRRVFILGALDRAEQLALMRRAAAIVQPSLFEGWSTVVEEARALGRAALLSDIPVHREQNPPMARFFDPHDPEALAHAMEAAWAAPPPLPDPEEAARAQADHVRACARRFLEVAARARETYRFERHDPAAILPEVLAGLGDPKDASLEGRLAERTLAGARGMFRGDREAFDRLIAHCEPFGGSVVRYAKKWIGPLFIL
jgi:glycosyltransferase involved in cell wall biosynthesis